jgi:voltage-gated potassium channel Kch
MDIASRNPIWTALILLTGVLTAGTCGYMVLEGYSIFEGIYMTVITVTTVGFGELRPLSDPGRGFTTLLILIGFGALAFVGHSLAESLFVNISSGMSEIKKMKKRISQLKSHYIICGFGRVGASAVDHFIESKVPFVIIEANPKLIKEIREEGYNVIEGDATHEDLLLEAGIKSASGVLALLDSDPDNLFIVLTGRELNPVLHIIARVDDTSSEKKIIRAGADSVISPFTAAGNQIACNILTATGRMKECIEQNTEAQVRKRAPGPRKIVIVDDNPTILRLYSRLFQKVGFLAITAADGKEGLRIITEEKPIAAVIDYDLPSLTGIEICEQVRSQQECKDMKLVLFTMDDRSETRTRALQAGANEVVIKSSEANELVDTVIKILREGST